MEVECFRLHNSTYQMGHYGHMMSTEFSSPISVTEREGNLHTTVYTIIQKSNMNYHKALNILNCSYFMAKDYHNIPNYLSYRFC